MYKDASNRFTHFKSYRATDQTRSYGLNSCSKEILKIFFVLSEIEVSANLCQSGVNKWNEEIATLHESSTAIIYMKTNMLK